MEKITLVKETETFNWEIPTGLSVNKKINSPSTVKVYCHEEYAQTLYKIYSGSIPENFEASKDLTEGEVYKCTISNISDNSALAYTQSGQTIYIDIKKEMKEAEKLGITAIDFFDGSSLQAIVREINGTYYGSVVECFVNNLKNEFFEQIKLESNAYVARIKAINKGGYLVDVSGVECFLPGSLAAANKITDFESYLGKTIYVMIDGYVPGKDIFVVSYKKYLSRIIGERIQNLDLTKPYKGIVTGASAFGLFVEWDEIFTGLIHKSEFENEIVTGYNTGDEVEFFVKEIKEDNKLTLTFGKPSDRTNKLYELKELAEAGKSTPMDATVKFRRKNGALVELDGTSLMALVPQDRLKGDDKNSKPGDFISVLVYEVDPLSGKIFAQSAQ